MNENAEMLEKIYRRHYLTVYRLALAKCGGRKENAEDIFGDVFLQLARYLSKGNCFSDENHEKAWLIRVTLNCSKAILRTYSRSNEAVNEQGYIVPQYEKSDTYDAVMSLSEKYRVVIHLFYYEGYSVRETSKLLKVSENTVKSRLARGRKLLKTKIEQERKGDFYEFGKL